MTSWFTGETLFWLAAKSTAILVIAALLDKALFRASAAVRHLVWAAALAALLLLPFLGGTLPRWEAPSQSLAATLSSADPVIAGVAAAGEGPRSSLPGILWGLWAVGCLFLLARHGWGCVQVARLVRRAGPLPGWGGAVLLSGRTPVPLVCGFWRPRILLPREAASWPASRLRMVLRHERMHIRRHDTRVYCLSQLVCALYWPSPLVWYAASRLRREAEKACDDGVLAQGEVPAEYAGELVEIVQDLRSAGEVFQGGLAMGHRSDLESRLSAMLKPDASRRGATPLLVSVAFILSLLTVLPLASVQGPGQPLGAIGGVVRDATGAVVPGAQVTVGLMGTDRKEYAVANEVGQFLLRPVPEGTYSVSVAKPGFALFRNEGIEVKSGATTEIQVVLNLGQISERMEVRGQAPESMKGIVGGVPGGRAPLPPLPGASSQAPPPPGAPPAQGMRIRVGGNVQQAKLDSRTRPVYPLDCKAEGVQGTVALRAIIGRDGAVQSLEQINELVDPRLVAAAKDAVLQWRYQPTLLNGQPVEVITEIVINFALTE